MVKAGTIQSIIGNGTVTATTPEGKTREVKQGDVIYEGETLATQGNVSVTIINDAGQEIASIGPNSEQLIDETVTTKVAEEDATVKEVAAMQAALEQGEEIPEEETAEGEEDRFDGDAFGYYEGDQDAGAVDPRALGVDPTGTREIGDGDVDNYDDLIEALSAIDISVDETDGLNDATEITGTITVDYGTDSGFLVLSAEGAVWDAGSSTLTYAQDGTPIWEMAVNQATGQYVFTQLAALDHGPDDNDHNALAEFEITVLATNADGNSATTTFTAGIFDDGPSIDPQPYQAEGIDDIVFDTPPLQYDYPNGSGVMVFNGSGLGTNEHVFTHTGGRITIDFLTETKGSPYSSDPPGTYPDVDGDGVQEEGDIRFALYNADTDEFIAERYYDGFGRGGNDGSQSDYDPFLSLPDLPPGNYRIVVNGYSPYSTELPYQITITDNIAPDVTGDPMAITGDESDGLVVKEVPAEALNVDFGTDGPGEISLSVDGGIWDAETQTLTYYQGEEAAWQIVLTGDAESGYGYEFTQLTAIDHDVPGDGSDGSHDETASWEVTMNVVDSDGGLCLPDHHRGH
ncbi:MAG: hypothetical protein HUK40_17710 [Desulfobacter sp.]|nr:hypothetical protein [Desulfobacter sp.]